jgi:hypothetical protein
VSHNPPPFHRVGRVSTMRERWRHQSDFIADVLRFGLYSWHYPAAHQDEMADAKDEMIGGSDPVQAVHRVAYWAMTRLLGTPMFRLGLIAAAEAEGDPVIGEAVSQHDRANDPLWKSFYEDFISARGLRVRSGVTLDDCVTLLAAVADGLTLRALADPAARVIDHDRRRCLLGTAALAFIGGCLEPADRNDGLSLEQAVRAMTSVPAANSSRKAG